MQVAVSGLASGTSSTVRRTLCMIRAQKKKGANRKLRSAKIRRSIQNFVAFQTSSHEAALRRTQTQKYLRQDKVAIHNDDGCSSHCRRAFQHKPRSRSEICLPYEGVYDLTLECTDTAALVPPRDLMPDFKNQRRFRSKRDACAIVC